MKNLKSLIVKFVIALVLLTGLPNLTLAETNNSGYDFYENYFRVAGGYTRTHTFGFDSGDCVNISISGDGDTDLDLYVYGANGLIARSAGYSDDESIHFDVGRGGYFYIKVVNRGRVYNHYELTITAE
jgi:hypothetical protein